MRYAAFLADEKSRFFFVVLSLSLNMFGFLGANAVAQNTFPATGNVGIGTTTPGVGVSMTGGLTINGTGSTVLNIQSHGFNAFAIDPGSSGAWTLFDNASGGWVASITSNSGKVGIGTTAPASSLDVNGMIHVAGQVSPTTSTQGAYLGWNTTNGQGETDFINNQGLGIGGWYFITVPEAGSPQTNVLKISPTGAVTFADGTIQQTAWSGVLCGGDYAESVDVSGDRAHIGPGDVLVIDPNTPGKFLKSVESYSTAVLGVYSTKPGVLGRHQTGPTSPNEVPMAMLGIVPTKVSAENGPIRPGDLLVTASTPGHAMRGTDRGRLLGAIVGKAMGTLESGTGVIEVGVTLQ